MNLIDKIKYLRDIKHNHGSLRIYKHCGVRKVYSVFIGERRMINGLYVYYINGKYSFSSIQKENIINKINNLFIQYRKGKIKKLLKWMKE